MGNIITRRARPEMIEQPTIDWQRSEILFPFHASGNHVVIRFNRNQYLRFVSECEELFARIRRRDRQEGIIEDIDRNDRLVTGKGL